MMRKGSGAAGPAPATEPYNTPHRRRLQDQGPGDAAINQVILSLENDWRLGLRIRGAGWSPTRSSTKDTADKIYGLVKRLHWSGPPTLSQAIANFNELAPQFKHSERLDLLWKTLSSKAKPHAISRAGTPKNDPPESLKSSIPGSKTTPQPENLIRQKIDNNNDASNEASSSSKNMLDRLSREASNTGSNACQRTRRTRSDNEQTRNADVPAMDQQVDMEDRESYATALEPGSPTDVDTEDEFVTPPSPSPSPSPSTRSARRKLKASKLVSSQSNLRKRPSDSSDYSEKSPKLTRTTKGKEPVNTAGLFKMPSIDLLRSFQAGASTISSANTSFNNTVNSSQETNANTVNTSSTSYDGLSDHEHPPKLTRTSATTIGSLSDHEFLNIARKSEKDDFDNAKQRDLERMFSQDASRESNSTFGSIDEDDLLDVSTRLEASAKMSPRNSRALQTPHTGITSVTQSFPGPTVTLEPSKPVQRPRSSSVGIVSEQSRNLKKSENLADSPRKTPYYIRDLPGQNLFVDTSSADKLTAYPYFILFICCRLSLINDVSLENLVRLHDPISVSKDREIFWQNLNPSIAAGPREPKAIWTAAKKSFEGYTFKGKITFNGRYAPSSNVFDLNLLPIEKERSCLFQRMFGSDRFLYLTFPSFTEDKPERFDQDQMLHIADQWRLWLMQPHSFLGRTWRAFHVEPVKKRAVRRDNSADKRVILFATEGTGIDKKMQIGEMINRFMDLHKNQRQNYCKAYARLDLGLSRTIPTLTFKPSQIRWIKDTLATRDPDATEFNDMNLDWSERCNELPVMNDGCSRISAAALVEIWKIYQSATGSNEPLPSAIQGRIGGAKGMWMISGAPQSAETEQEHQAIWIEISESQRKFDPTTDDEYDHSFDHHRLTFNYVKHSFVNGSTELHISFLPILAHRGVPKYVLAELMKNGLDQERENLLEILAQPVRLHNWIAKQSCLMSEQGLLNWEASLPMVLPEKAKLLLRSGFSPDQNPYLAKQVKRFVRQRQTVMEQKLRTPLGKSTFLYGLADPESCLNPGEVHIQFSAPFYDEHSKSTFRTLHGLEVLVARQPALRPSDIQKVRAISHPKLSHLVDVIVFSVKGPFPLAEKLQGGDYDGDTFWTCWERDLVTPFRNAPAPLNAPDPSKYGIRKDPRKLHDLMDPKDLNTTDRFLEAAFLFRSQPSLLGKSTNFWEKVAYQQNLVTSEKIDALCDVHDLLVDAPKQGYIFSDDDFTSLVRAKLRCGKPRVPPYKDAMEASTKIKDLGEEDIDPVKNIKHNSKNIIDYLYFRVVRKHNYETCKLLKKTLPKEENDDAELKLPFLQLRRDAGRVLAAELDALVQRFDNILSEWNRGIATTEKSDPLFPQKYSKILENCYKAYTLLLPSTANAREPDIAPLIYPYLGPNHPTTWEMIRASALYTTYPRRSAFVWQMAGKILAQLKTSGNPNTYNVVPAIFADLKTKPVKAPKREEDEESEEELESVSEGFLS